MQKISSLLKFAPAAFFAIPAYAAHPAAPKIDDHIIFTNPSEITIRFPKLQNGRDVDVTYTIGLPLTVWVGKTVVKNGQEALTPLGYCSLSGSEDAMRYEIGNSHEAGKLNNSATMIALNQTMREMLTRLNQAKSKFHDTRFNDTPPNQPEIPIIYQQLVRVTSATIGGCTFQDLK